MQNIGCLCWTVLKEVQYTEGKNYFCKKCSCLFENPSILHNMFGTTAKGSNYLWSALLEKNWGKLKIQQIYRWIFNDIWVSLHSMSKYSLKFQFSSIFSISVQLCSTVMASIGSQKVSGTVRLKNRCIFLWQLQTAQCTHRFGANSMFLLNYG